MAQRLIGDSEKKHLEAEKTKLERQKFTLEAEKLRKSQLMSTDVLRLSRNLEGIRSKLSKKELQLKVEGASTRGQVAL